MKKLFTILFSFTAFASTAQPVISNGNNIPPFGASDSISVSTTALSPGSGGANVTWDYSSLVCTVAGKATYVDPATTPYTATYPSANKAIKIEIPTGTIYEYDIVSASKWEMLANNVTATTGQNYTPNPKTMMPFPFHYNDVVTDTYQELASGTGSVTMTYDGYGTLITPYGTYNNVVRMKRDFGGPTDYYYDYYISSPYLQLVVSFDANVSKYTVVKTGTTGVSSISGNKTTVLAYPNPFSSTTTVSVNTTENLSNATLVLTDMTGKAVKEVPANTREITVDRAGLNAGLYFYSVYNNGVCLAKGKISIQ